MNQFGHGLVLGLAMWTYWCNCISMCFGQQRGVFKEIEQEQDI